MPQFHIVVLSAALIPALTVSQDSSDTVAAAPPIQLQSLLQEDGRYVLEMSSPQDPDSPSLLAGTIEIQDPSIPGGRYRLLPSATGRVQLTVDPPSAPRVRIGISTQPVDGALAAQLSLTQDEAIVVVDVHDGGPAATGGIVLYDVITHIDGTTGATQDRLAAIIQSKQHEEPLYLRVIREGEYVDVTIMPESIQTDFVGFEYPTPWTSVELAEVAVPTLVTTTEYLDFTDIVDRSIVRDYYATVDDLRVASLWGGQTLLIDPSVTSDPAAQIRKELAQLRTSLERLEELLEAVKMSDDSVE